ncbi:hypothetical protein ACSBR1_035363 [Camellia fascicularis]
MFINGMLVLIWADILAMYAMWMMMLYLTNVWKLNFTHAAAIINVFWGLMAIMLLPIQFLVDAFMVQKGQKGASKTLLCGDPNTQLRWAKS